MLNIKTALIKTAILFVLVIAIVILPLVYNRHFLDAAIANLHIASLKVNKLKVIEEYQEISPFIDMVLLDELSSKIPDLTVLAKLEFIQDILNHPQDTAQIEDIKIFLEDILEAKYKQKPELFYQLDRIIVGFSSQKLRRPPEAKLNPLAVDLSKRILSLKTPFELQRSLFELGIIFVRLEKFDKAEEVFKKMIEIQADSDLTLQGRFNLAWANRLQDKFDLSISIFSDLAKEYPATELASYCKYEIGNLMQKNLRFFEALDIYNSLEADEPGTFFTRLAQFQAAYLHLYNPVLKDYQAADRKFRKMQEGTVPDKFRRHIEKKVIPRLATYYRNLGFILIFQKEYENAIRCFSRGLEVFPNYACCYSGQALAYLNLNDKERALAKARRASRITPNDPIVSVNLGFIYISLGMVDEAIEEYKRFISVYPKSKEAYYNLGYAYVVKGNSEAAISELRQATELDPGFARAYNNIGYILWHSGRYAEAIIEFKKAVQLQYRYPGAHFNLGLALMIQGRYIEAKNEFEIVLALAPDDSVAAANLKELKRIISTQQ